jgi:hypothetical protein
VLVPPWAIWCGSRGKIANHSLILTVAPIAYRYVTSNIAQATLRSRSPAPFGMGRFFVLGEFCVGSPITKISRCSQIID